MRYALALIPLAACSGTEQEQTAQVEEAERSRGSLNKVEKPDVKYREPEKTDPRNGEAVNFDDSYRSNEIATTTNYSEEWGEACDLYKNIATRLRENVSRYGEERMGYKTMEYQISDERVLTVRIDIVEPGNRAIVFEVSDAYRFRTRTLTDTNGDGRLTNEEIPENMVNEEITEFLQSGYVSPETFFTRKLWVLLAEIDKLIG